MHKCLMLILLVVEISLSLPHAAHAASTKPKPPVTRPREKPLEQKRLQILQTLKKQKYFRFESCTEVANGILHKNGLPLLGQSIPVVGRRGPFKRSIQAQELPVFMDEITPPTAGSVKLQILSQPLKNTPPERWELRLKRSGTIPLRKGLASVELDTRFIFDLAVIAGRKTCELTTFEFKLANKPADKSLRPEQVSIRECIDLFLTNANSSAQEVNWVKEDCAFALHYSTEAKNALGIKSP